MRSDGHAVAIEDCGHRCAVQFELPGDRIDRLTCLVHPDDLELLLRAQVTLHLRSASWSREGRGVGSPSSRLQQGCAFSRLPLREAHHIDYGYQQHYRFQQIQRTPDGSPFLFDECLAPMRPSLILRAPLDLLPEHEALSLGECVHAEEEPLGDFKHFSLDYEIRHTKEESRRVLRCSATKS